MVSISSILSAIYRTGIYTALKYIVNSLFAFIYLLHSDHSDLWAI